MGFLKNLKEQCKMTFMESYLLNIRCTATTENKKMQDLIKLYLS